MLLRSDALCGRSVKQGRRSVRTAEARIHIDDQDTHGSWKRLFPQRIEESMRVGFHAHGSCELRIINELIARGA